jgi:hypothetical protein
MPDLSDLTPPSGHATSGRGKLGLFCAFYVRPGQIGFVLRILPPAPAPGRGKSGLFCTFRPRAVNRGCTPINADHVIASEARQSKGRRLRTSSLPTIVSGIVTNGTKRAAVHGAETLLGREFSCLVLTFPAGGTTSCGLAVPSARRRRFCI